MNTSRFVALLRGINVGGHHKVPMATLKKELESLGLENVVTLLNSGNVIFDAPAQTLETLEAEIETHLQKIFGFAIPVILTASEVFLNLAQNNPFRHIVITPDTRLYVSFLKEPSAHNLTLPWTSPDGTFQIMEESNKLVFSVLDLAVTQSPKGMDSLEILFGRNITTRNWNTVIRIADKIGK